MGNLILEAISQTAKTAPMHLCFDDRQTGETLTYGELEKESDGLAAYFSSKFSGKEPILVAGGLTKEVLVSFIACMKAGHPYVPVDSHTPAERIKLIHEEAEPVCVVAFDQWEIPAKHLVRLKEFDEIVKKSKSYPSENQVTGDDLTYIIFTSGTTGKPKGVQISYNNLASFLQWMMTDFSLAQGQRYLCQAPFSFDLSVMDVFPALLTGGTLVPLEKDTVDNFPVLFRTLPDLKLNVWVSTPSLIEICLVTPDFRAGTLPELSHFLFCGEELPHKVADKLLERFPQAKIYNTYGPTEATVAVSGVQITKEILEKYERLPLGKVKEDTKIYIFDDQDQPLSEGEFGEVVIAGPSVSRGYFRNADKTAESFFSYQGLPAYRTGDGGYLKDGLLFYQGRLDFQIKWHGYRMELGDIDHHLLSLSSVQKACVVPKYQNHKVQQLIAYVVLEQGEPENPRETAKALKGLLKEKLMAYMMPQKFVFASQLPLTSNGKIDRKQLMAEVNPS
ncbi:D-alanine--poly(phosphoribitol) ligase subunit DltA [Vagococcus elongatus]|uniref:D-alanine--D-alanyl carrier protein ligase n=1 Tax=Vagococcus elongatus TaxID=180344 RepID=A0A430AP71_9ENTE|nr:D-alanine--poly(phosphoribitol) ligase subunit DltA [Vagococcus elongatus]RSU09704.1 D-alanine--poly(phosphoribitol) ligase subunit 1 [Vagococcus elongatus]